MNDSVSMGCWCVGVMVMQEDFGNTVQIRPQKLRLQLRRGKYICNVLHPSHFGHVHTHVYTSQFMFVVIPFLLHIIIL